MNHRTSFTSRRTLRAYIAAFISYLMLVGQVAPLALAANNSAPRPAPVNVATGGAAAGFKAAPAPAPLAPLVPSISAQKTDSFPDSNGDGKAAPGEEITYAVKIENTGTEASNVQFTDMVDPNTTFVANSVTMSPLARADAYNATLNTPLVVAAAQGVLANDSGIPAPTAVTLSNAATTSGGTVTLNSDGSFTYNPPNATFQGTDTFTYTAQNSSPETDSALVTITVDAAPTVTATTPTNGATQIANTANVTVTFSEAVTAPASAFTISCATSGSHAFALSGGPTTFTLNPTVDFTNGEVCTVTVVAANVTDNDTNDPPDQMAANFVFSFTVDNPPTVTATTPANGATGVASNANIDITFSEAVTAASNAFTISCATSGSHAFALSGGPTTFTLNPTVDFATTGEVCTVTVVAANVTDNDTGDPPDNMTANFVFTFTVDAAPTVTATTPTNGATQIANNANVTVTFSEAVTAASNAFTISCATSGSHTFVLSGGPTTFTLNPDTDFTNGELCTVTVVAANVTDNDTADPPDNMAANFVFTFTIDNPPTVTSTTPTNGQLNVAANTNITVNFSEPVNATTSSFKIECPSGPANAQAFTLSSSPATSFTLDPNANLPLGVICTVTVVANQITDTDAGDPPDQMAADYVFSFSIPPDATNDTRNATGNVRIVTTGRSNFSVLANDIFPAADPVTITAFDATSARGGQVSIVSNTGTFSYNPPAGYEGPDSFNYTITNAAGSDTATVNITISGMLWFIDDSASTCTTNDNTCGRLTNPFSTLAAFESFNGNATPTNGADVIAPEPGEHIFIYAGSYTAPLTLEANQRVIGEGATSSFQTLSGVTPATDSDTLPPTGGTKPSITSAGNGVNVVSNNQLYGLAFSNTGGTAVNSNSNVGTLVIGDVTINNSGSNGAGIIIDDNGTAFTTTGLNTINTRSGVGLNVTNTPIGSGNITFQSISVGNNDANTDPASGIILNTTGTAAANGGLIITGTATGSDRCGGTVTVNAPGTPATINAPVVGECTGGLIQNTTSNGITLNGTKNFNVQRLRVLNSGADGINVLNINGFALANSNITDSAGAAGDRGIEMGDFSTGTPVNGAITVTNTRIGPTPHDNFGVGIQSGTSTWNITGTVFDDSQLNSGFNFEIRNATVSSFLMDDCVLQSQFADGMQMQPASGTNGTITSATIQDSTFTGNNIGMDLNHDGTANITYKVFNNTFRTHEAQPINLFSSAVQAPTTGGTLNARFEGNVIGNAGINDSGSRIGNGLRVNINGGVDATVLINNNNIRQTPNGRGIEVISRNGTGGLDATVTNNNVDNNFRTTPENSGFSLAAILLQSNCVGACNTLRSDVRGNTVPAAAPNGELILAQLILVETSGTPNPPGTSTLQLVDTTAPVSGTCASELAGTNTGSTNASAGCQLIAGPLTTPPSLRGTFDRDETSSGAPVVKERDAEIMTGTTIDTAPAIPVEVPAAPVTNAPARVWSDMPVIITRTPRTNDAAKDDDAAKDEEDAAKDDDAANTSSDDSAAPKKARKAKKPARVKGTDEQPENRNISYLGPLGSAPSNAPRFARASYEVGDAVRTARTTVGDAVVTPTRNTSAQTTPKAARAAAAALFAPEVNVSIGTLPGSKTVYIRFKVKVNDPFPVGTTQVSNQGTVAFTGGSVLTDDPAVGNSNDPTVTPVSNIAEIRINDAKVAEPVSPNTTNMVFTVSLSQPAGGPVSVNFATADGSATAGTCGSPGADYTANNNTLNFATGEQVKTINVLVCSDAVADDGETFLVNLSNPTGGTIIDGTGTGTITANTPGTFIISELRTSGPAGAGDDFVEFYNNTNSPLTVAATDASAGYGLFKMGASCNDTPVLLGTIPNGTVIPARGHYLMVGSAYSLANYGGTGAAAGNLTFSSDLGNDQNVGIFTTSNIVNVSSVNRLDGVGFGTNVTGVCDMLHEGSPLGAVAGSTTEHAFFRKECDYAFNLGCLTGGNPKDANDNSADFTFADTQGTLISGIQQKLGAPGPQNLASPVRRDSSGLSVSLLDSTVSPSANVNRSRSFSMGANATFGTLTVRRRIVNNTGGPVTRLRFRIIEMTTFPSPGGGQSDLRALTSTDEPSVGPINDATTCTASGAGAPPCSVLVRGVTLEQLPTQPNGGGINSTLSVGTITLGTPLANGASLNVNFLLGIQQTESFRFYIIAEALP